MDKITFALLGNRFPEAGHFFRRSCNPFAPLRYRYFQSLACLRWHLSAEQIMTRTMTALEGLQQDS
jgi:hypothetical protein